MMIKVCGITRSEDAALAIAGGATALGFNFYHRSPRYLKPEDALPILRELRDSGALRVGVFVIDDGRGSTGWRERLQVVRHELDAVQLHGVSTSEEIPATGLRTLIGTTADQVRYFPKCEILIDPSWGRGEQADWSALENLAVPYILAGGLSAENVSEALSRLQPAGLDVCSGVEQSPGIKDREKLRAFLLAAQRFRHPRPKERTHER